MTSPTPTYRRSIGNRIATRLLGLPTPLLHRLTGVGGPVEVEGRVLHPSLAAMRSFAVRAGQTRSVDSPAARRVELDRLASVGMPSRCDVRVTDRIALLGEVERRVRIYRPFGITSTLPGIVYYHGGGWVTGSLDSHDGCCRVLAGEAGAVVVAIDYRLAPEHPFPAAVDDAIAAYRWVVGHASEFGIVADRVGVMGDSAGGTLAAVTAQQVAGAPDGLPVPVAQCLVYPATDAHLSSRSHVILGDGFFLTKADMEWFRGHYLPDDADFEDVRASPLLAEDFSGLPPAVVVTAGFDPLRDEGDAYAARLVDAGVPVIHRCYDDLVHGFFGMGMLPGGLDTIVEICRAMGSLLHSPA